MRARELYVCLMLGLAAIACASDLDDPLIDLDGADELDGEVLKLRAVGDVMMGTDFPSDFLPPDDGQFLLDDVAPLISNADLTFANLEGPLCDGGTTSKCSSTGNCFAFRTPTRYGQYLADAGIDVVSLANNHALDFGEGCRQETIDTLDGLGIAHSGRPGTFASIRRGDLEIALVAFHTAQHSNWLNDHEAAAELVSEVSMTHDIVLVSFHGGAEGSSALHVPDGPESFFGENRGDLRRFTRAVIDAGADVVLGHGPHVPRGMEIVDGRLVAYSLGNFATFGRFSLTGPKGVSLVLDLRLDQEGAFLGGRILPVVLVDGGFPVRDESGASIELIGELSIDDFPDTAVVVDADGRLRPPQ